MLEEYKMSMSLFQKKTNISNQILLENKIKFEKRL